MNVTVSRFTLDFWPEPQLSFLLPGHLSTFPSSIQPLPRSPGWLYVFSSLLEPPTLPSLPRSSSWLVSYLEKTDAAREGFLYALTTFTVLPASVPPAPTFLPQPLSQPSTSALGRILSCPLQDITPAILSPSPVSSICSLSRRINPISTRTCY